MENYQECQWKRKGRNNPRNHWNRLFFLESNCFYHHWNYHDYYWGKREKWVAKRKKSYLDNWDNIRDN